MSPNIKFIEEMDDLQKAPELKNFFMLCSATFESATSIQLQKFRS